MWYGQYPENPKFADPAYTEKWLNGEWVYMNDKEQEELLLHYGPRKLRKAIKERRKAQKARPDDGSRAFRCGVGVCRRPGCLAPRILRRRFFHRISVRDRCERTT